MLVVPFGLSKDASPCIIGKVFAWLTGNGYTPTRFLVVYELSMTSTLPCYHPSLIVQAFENIAYLHLPFSACRLGLPSTTLVSDVEQCSASSRLYTQDNSLNYKNTTYQIKKGGLR